MLARFLRDRRGSIAPLFGIAAIPLLGGVGVAVDYSRATATKAAFQAALDSTALMLSKSAANQSAATLQTSANTYFNALFTRASDVKNLTLTTSYSSTGGSKVVLSGTATLPTNFLGVQVPPLPVHFVCELPYLLMLHLPLTASHRSQRSQDAA